MSLEKLIQGDVFKNSPYAIPAIPLLIPSGTTEAPQREIKEGTPASGGIFNLMAPPAQAIAPAHSTKTIWRELATLTAGLEPGDPRVAPVLDSLTKAEQAQDAGDRDGFDQAVARTKHVMQFAPGALVWWNGSVGHRLKVLGPAMIETVHADELGRLWVFTIWQGQERWVNEALVTKIARG